MEASKVKRIRFDRLNSSCPQPEDFDRKLSRISDPRAELSTVRTELRCITRNLPERYSSAALNLATAMDALNRALGDIILTDSDITQTTIPVDHEAEDERTIAHR